MSNAEFQSKSYWMKTRAYAPGDALREDIDVDVAIIGGGFTGLSTAYHLKKTEPAMRIAILESEVIGFGASGRNGGFNMTLFGLTLSITALRFGKTKAREAHHYMERAVDLLRDLVHYRLTADNRIVMGGRDVSLGKGSDMDRDHNEEIFEGLRNDVREIFPPLKDITFSDAWGGPVSVPIDMAPAIGYLGDKRVVYSLGCVGHGVSLTHLNGQTVRDLVLERQTDLSNVFFVNRTTIPWPPEPLRGLTIKAIVGYMHIEDRIYDAKKKDVA
jgi:glycine/D-amino acid oxidase-like deaminating enzyme